MTDLKEISAAIRRMAADLLHVIETPFEKTTELQRQVLAAFAFGMVFAVGQFEGLSPPQVHALVIKMLMDNFKYSDHQAVAFAQDLIDSASGRGNPTTNAIIHRGIDGHAQWQQRNSQSLKANLEDVFRALEA